MDCPWIYCGAKNSVTVHTFSDTIQGVFVDNLEYSKCKYCGNHIETEMIKRNRAKIDAAMESQTEH